MRISVNTSNKFSTFGSTQPNPNNLNANQYRYGFGGMEQDKQTGSYTTYFRQYDPRIARWKSTDPVTQPWQSPYTAFDNNPIFYTDPSGAIAIPNKRRGIGAGGSIGGIGGALAGSAQTLLSLAIRSGMQASMVGTYMQSAMLPTSSATNSGRELGVGNESISSNNLAANDLYACTTCPREVNEGNGNKKTLTPAQKIDYTISESKSKFDADFDYILNGTEGNYLTRWAETFSRDWNAASFTDKADFSIDLASAYFPFIRIGKLVYRFSEHALMRIAIRNIPKKYIKEALTNKPFDYFHDGTWKKGFYDPKSKTFIGTKNGEIKTVIDNVSPEYIERLISNSKK
ncbi:MAG: hypothetical protein HND27_05185 [Bacteroidetes bacterium]|nr:hypothetical protein [Bacteroidota bacterium]NOG95154.1 hypothetical protein [Bacteroidota bacterium]